ncbi:MAG: phosphotransferase, partial [Polyangiales bacterium]
AIPSRTIAFDPDTNSLCMAWVHGQPLSEVLERAQNDSSARRRCAHAMRLVGVLLQRLRTATRKPDAQPSPFLHEYMAYVSNGLEGLPILGRARFRGYGAQAETLWRELLRARETPSTCHGDLALKNIRMRGYRAGLIDFASTNDRSHLLSDIYGLFVHLRTGRFDDTFRRSLLDSLFRGIGKEAAYPDPVHRFHWEMQRRRWLFFKLVQGNAAQHLEGLRGLSELGLPLLDPQPVSLPS